MSLIRVSEISKVHYDKNEESPLLAKNEIRADIFSGSLAVFQSERVASAGGGGGIRTHGRREATRAFQARALGHYATPPFDASRIITFLGGRPIKSLSTFCSRSRTPKKFRIHNGERFCQVFAILCMLKA